MSTSYSHFSYHYQGSFDIGETGNERFTAPSNTPLTLILHWEPLKLAVNANRFRILLYFFVHGYDPRINSVGVHGSLIASQSRGRLLFESSLSIIDIFMTPKGTNVNPFRVSRAVGAAINCARNTDLTRIWVGEFESRVILNFLGKGRKNLSTV